jgi:hypothetical protein
MPIYKVIKNGKWGRMDTTLKGGKIYELVGCGKGQKRVLPRHKHTFTFILLISDDAEGTTKKRFKNMLLGKRGDKGT